MHSQRHGVFLEKLSARCQTRAELKRLKDIEEIATVKED